MPIGRRAFTEKIKKLMSQGDAASLRYMPTRRDSETFIQYRPNESDAQDWDYIRCHFEFEIKGSNKSVTSCSVAFHVEKDFASKSELGQLIGNSEKFNGLKRTSRHNIENACIAYKVVEVGEADPDVKAKEAVDAMIEFYQKYGDEILRLIEQSKNSKEQINYITLLLKNHNIILHGAPGTGKTYLAKEIAKEIIFGDAEKNLTPEEQEQFNERCGFVQFHQSYDYTDFVEGLRPVNQAQGKIGFELKDGVFKAFCQKALNFVVSDSSESMESASSSVDDATDNSANSGDSSESFDIDELINQGIEKLKEELRSQPNQTMTIPGVRRNDVVITLVENDIFANPQKRMSDRATPYKVRMESVVKTYIKTKEYDKSHFTYEPAVGQYIIDHFMPSTVKDQIENGNISEVATPIPPDAFVFIIDEINRGEMSKIFGELFFSIDPEYRGEKGKIKTQYQNLIDAKDPFADGFFIPKNVYIIGTMNDIDRSVESMDFAMRRRFAFKEIEAKDRIEMLDEIKDEKLKKLAIAKMNALNIAIEKTEGLSSAYHIGPAYFLKLDNYGGDFEKLWKFHIEGVVREYLRGMDDAKGKQEKIETAYKEAKAE